MKTTISRPLKRKFLKSVASAPPLERERVIKALILYDHLVFLERYLLAYGLGEVSTFEDYFTLRDFSDLVEYDPRPILRDLKGLDKALEKGGSLSKTTSKPSYKRLISNFSSYLSELFVLFKIPFSLEERRHNKVSFYYFATPDWVGVSEIPTEIRRSLSESLLEHNETKREIELRVKEALYVLKNTKLPEMNLLDDTWTEEEKESIRLSGVLKRRDVLDPISKYNFEKLTKSDVESERIDDPARFEFLDKNIPKNILSAYATLEELKFSIREGASSSKIHRFILKDISGSPIYIFNDLFEKSDCSGAGFGSQIVFGQIISALKQPSIKGISLLAGGEAHFVGSKVWPKFGYDGQVRVSDFSFSEDIKDYLHRVRKGDSDLISISDILSAVDRSGRNIGLSWWSENAISFNGFFDLNPSSLSMRVFTSYFRKKLSQFGVGAEEFLSMDLPVDLSDSLCFIVTLNKIESTEELKSLMPDILASFGSLDKEEQPYILEEIRGKFPVLADILKSKRGSSQYTDPTAESVWTEIGQEMIIASEAQRARELLVRS